VVTTSYWSGYPHVISADQFGKSWLLDALFPAAERMVELVKLPVGERPQPLAGMGLYNLFYRESTRTRARFSRAMQLLGGTVEGTEDAEAFSSAKKGETLEDTIRTICSLLYDVIVIRHHEEGSAAKAAQASFGAPIINAGDGSGEHPTQALLDLYTIFREFGRIDGLSIALVGDLNRGRTVRSLARLLAKFDGVTVYMVSPSPLAMREDVKEYLRAHDTKYFELLDLREVAPLVHSVYLTRSQEERPVAGATTRVEIAARFDQRQPGQPDPLYGLNEEILELLQDHAIIMHPLPRNDVFGELPSRFTEEPRVRIFHQVTNGLYISMALLVLALAPQ